MSTNIYPWFKFWAFRLDAEKAHNLALKTFRNFPSIYKLFPHFDVQKTSKYSLKVGSTQWPFPVGLAAGLDKNGEAIDFFSKLGFGAVEVGTVTPRAQPGNEAPRLFRYPTEKSLRNRMGFNNQGALALEMKLKNNKFKIPIGVNLGKNKDTPHDKAFVDYRFLYQTFSSLADYLVVNVSSPNTPGLRNLQSKSELDIIFSALTEEREKVSCPLYLKVSPDVNLEEIDEICELAQKYNLEGIIATNTTIMKELGDGGVSGELLKDKARKMRNHLLKVSKSTDLEIIGVGGISQFSDLVEFWKNGGKVAQIYTSFIYQGPQILLDIKNEIDRELDKLNLSTLQEYLDVLSKG